jgi:hypothetical protein
VSKGGVGMDEAAREKMLQSLLQQSKGAGAPEPLPVPAPIPPPAASH